MGDAGWVVEPTPAAMADGLAKAAAGAAELAATARTRYETTFAPGPVIERLIGVYADLAGTVTR